MNSFPEERTELGTLLLSQICLNMSNIYIKSVELLLFSSERNGFLVFSRQSLSSSHLNKITGGSSQLWDPMSLLFACLGCGNTINLEFLLLRCFVKQFIDQRCINICFVTPSVIDWNVFIIHLHNKLLATGISFCRIIWSITC